MAQCIRHRRHLAHGGIRARGMGVGTGKIRCFERAILLTCGIVPVVLHRLKIVTRNQVLPAFTPVERHAAFSLSFLYITRMMGLFLLLPVLSVMAQDLDGATPLLIGLAVGVYALFQALLQIPFGLVSDRLGRKPVILAGLFIFIIGSFVAAASDSIWGIIIGRALQGGGAISSVIMALAGDLTRDSQRTKIMAIIGASIGLSFMLSIIIGPVLMTRFDLAGIFYFIACSGIVATLLVLFVIPEPQQKKYDRNISVALSEMPKLLQHPELLRIDFGIFVLHLLITAGFVCIPLTLLNTGVPAESHWSVYLAGMLGSLVILLPMIGFAERKLPVNRVMAASIVGLALALFLVGGFAGGYWMLVVSMVLFFGFLSVLESLLPSLASRTAPASLRGTAMGIYSTSQFFGAFIGGVAGGWLVGAIGDSRALMVLGVVCLCWLPVSWRMKSPDRLTNFRFAIKDSLFATNTNPAQLHKKLAGIAGVSEVKIVPGDKAAYLKIVKARFDESDLLEYRQTD